MICAGTRTQSFEWTPVPRDTHGRSPCTTWEIGACMGTKVSSKVASYSAGGVPLEIMAPARGSHIPLCGWCSCRYL
ncbi:unnamed protein product [Staurois parvus]|uniref:Uncharacterized protein n=1 Tax=Staurois parvus TaxID=386267 RepID=A0ABN9EPT4_9NEOB|nr:unnamed protein product [Staurois parvus]